MLCKYWVQYKRCYRFFKVKIIVGLMFCGMEHLNSFGRESAWCLVFLKIVCESLYEFSCLCIHVDQQYDLSFKLWQPLSIRGRTLLHPYRD